MKRLLGIFLVLFLFSTLLYGLNWRIAPAFAAEDDLWGNYNTNLSSPKESKYVSDEDFEQAIKKKNKKIDKWKNILLDHSGKPNGQERYQSNETEEISKNQGEDASLPILSTPAEIELSEGIIPVGHYQVKGENNDGKIVLNLYQSGTLIASIPAHETSEDYDEEEILFAGWRPESDNSIKIIYGSLDFNAYAIVNIK